MSNSKQYKTYVLMQARERRIEKMSGGYVMIPKETYDQFIAALNECQNYFDYMKGENHVASREARALVKAAIKKAIT